jgi:hypothetical protein
MYLSRERHETYYWEQQRPRGQTYCPTLLGPHVMSGLTARDGCGREDDLEGVDEDDDGRSEEDGEAPPLQMPY